MKTEPLEVIPGSRNVYRDICPQRAGSGGYRGFGPGYCPIFMSLS
jgi:hypothetical protein